MRSISCFSSTRTAARRLRPGSPGARTRETCSTVQTLPNGDGVDVNRNYSYTWNCCGGDSGTLCNALYHGAAAGSEPESTAVMAYEAAIFTDWKGPNRTDPISLDADGMFVDLHSNAAALWWPWGMIGDLAPNATQLQTLGRKLAYFNGYTPAQSYSDPASGCSDDHTFGTFGVATYTWELGGQFFENCESSFLPTTLHRNMPA